MKTILAPVDFSAVTDSVCDTAAALAKAQEGRVMLLHCVRPPLIAGEPMMETATAGLSDEAAAADRLSRLRERLAEDQCAVETLQVFGEPAPNILAQAEKLDAACLVLGSHNRGVFHEILAGSTTHNVMLKATCPVLIIHPGTSA